MGTLAAIVFPERSWRARLVSLCASVIVSAWLAPAVAAQGTRAEEQRLEQAAKRASLSPPTKNTAERVVERLRRFGFFEDDPIGFYPFVGKVYPSGGVAFGAGYRRAFQDTGALTATTALSVQNYKSAGLVLELPRMHRGRVAIDAALKWLDATSVPFYGLGSESRRETSTTFGYRPTTVGLTLRYGPTSSFTVGGGVDYLNVTATPGWTQADRPLLADAVPTPADGQGYIRARAFAALDSRTDEGFTGRGGLYRIDVDEYAASAGASASFRRVEGEAVQLVPILGANWVIALHGLSTLTYSSDTDAVPFYLMPTLGGSDLRGFSTMRFRGPQRALVGAELRWTPARLLDMAIFYQAGKVADRPRDLTRGTLERSYGVGARLHGQGRSTMRIDLAHSREHAVRVLLSVGVVF
jgi:hypothetical protein